MHRGTSFSTMPIKKLMTNTPYTAAATPEVLYRPLAGIPAAVEPLLITFQSTQINLR